MSLSPFDHFMQKSAVDALVPGQVGAGPNPGTLGTMDSDSATATNTDLAMQRFMQGSVPILSAPDADGGAGYSHPAPGTSPSLQMFADVKAAAIRSEAQAFAEQVYMEAKQANQAQQAPQKVASQEAQSQVENAGREYARQLINSLR